MAKQTAGMHDDPNEAPVDCLRAHTIREVFVQTDWMSAETLERLQLHPHKNNADPAADWRQLGRIFGVNYDGCDYYPRYQFDSLYAPVPVIKDILDAYGEVFDPWTLAAWFHFPNGHLVEKVAEGGGSRWRNLAPKDCLDRHADVVRAASNRRGTYVA